jgi:diadenosine tetraphosphate (Ap4A) HIT family hydrolase
MEPKNLFPNEKVIITKHFDVHQDWYIPIEGFFIIASRRKIRSVEEFTEEEAIEFIQLLKRLRRGMKQILGIEDVYIFQNEDTVHDFHLWVFPRHKWMDRFGRKIESVRPIMKYALENRADDAAISEVRAATSKMKYFMEKN